MPHQKTMIALLVALSIGLPSADTCASAVPRLALKATAPDTAGRPSPRPTVRRAAVRVPITGSQYATVAGPPAKPTDIKVLKSGSVRDGNIYDFVALMWADHAVNETGFVVERKVADGYQTVGRTAANETFFEDVGVDPHGWNQWRVKACNLHGCSDYAEFVQGGGAAQLKPNQRAPAPRDGNGGTGGGSDSDKCKAEGGVWIGLGIDHCSHALGAALATASAIVQGITNPCYQAYLVYFGVVGGGATLRSLPEDVIQLLKPYYGETLLREVRYGSSHHTASENTSMTDCKDIYFPFGSGHVDVIKNGRLLARDSQGRLVNEGTMRLLLHELQHARQCADLYGQANYAARWFSEMSGTTIVQIITAPTTVSSKTLHDKMPMEADAKDKESLAERL